MDESNRGTEFYTALGKLGGFGKYHYRLLLLMLPCSASGILVVNTLTYMSPAIICDFSLRKYQQSLLFSAVYFGMIFGGFIWGAMTDIIGRKATLLILLSITFIFETLAIFAFHYWQLFLIKFCSGFMGAGIMTTSYTYISEFVEPRYKDKMIMGAGMVTAIGFFFQPTIAIFTIPISATWRIIPNFLELNGWRIFQLICNLFPLAGFIILLTVLDESPAFLLRSGQVEKALDVLKKIYVVNTGKLAQTYEVKKLYLEEESTDQSTESFSFLYQMKLLFSRKYLMTVIVVILCQLLTMGAFGAIRSHLAIIITVSLGIGQKKGVHSDSAFCKLFKSQELYSDQPDCEGTAVHLTRQIYIFTTIIGFCIFISFFPLGVLVRKIGKPHSFSILHFVGGVSLIFVPFAQAYVVVLILTIYAVAMQNCITITVGLILDRVPTSVRGSTVAIIVTGGRLGVICGSLIFPTMTKISSCYFGFWTIALLNAVALPLIWTYSTLRNPLQYVESVDTDETH